MIIKKYFNNSVLLFKTKKFNDSRGSFSEIYNLNFFKEFGINDKFVQDNYSFSKKKFTIRGMHLQKYPYSQSKIVRVLSGKILDIIIDLRKNSKTFGKSKTFILSKKNELQLFVPQGFAHGFCTQENNTEVIYKASKYYSPKHEQTILWSDDLLKLQWKIDKNKVIINKKDLTGISFEEYRKL